ncbi:YaiI/YqxD family protein [Moraxella equi]|uniref:UPF0178 protein B5J93_04285 n=1 Tax=Moraxella equi TaxID=60442 RepID=A0A378QSE7_9GAMM|nr:YaiI/YqxD family protein [Moraxella equi]OPH39268.1 hypothetical protein B5J93_04285 [Moraxella equi]STZ03382.1 Uncharacterized BCR, YaiI/YqxD family COG1671 [Moraxella equi]
MIIYIDADAIPAIAKELIIKTANRTQVQAIFVANTYIKLPPSPYLKSVVVAQGFDVADDYIAEAVAPFDLVITSDTPLAFAVLHKGAFAFDCRGQIFEKETIGGRLSVRDFMDTMRHTGVLDPSQMGGQKPYSEKDKKNFADSLNKLIAKAKKRN